MRSKSKRYYDISIATYMLALLPFFVYFAIYGSLGLYPNYKVSSIDLKPLHDLELQLFGIMDGATKVIPGAYFQHHHHAFSKNRNTAHILYIIISYVLFRYGIL